MKGALSYPAVRRWAQRFRILNSQLNLSKVCASWVPYSITAAQNVQRNKCCKNLLKMYTRRDHRRLFEIITSDETWVRYDTPLSK